MDLQTRTLWVSIPETHLSQTIRALDAPLLEPTERSECDTQIPAEEQVYTYSGGLHAVEHGIIQLAPLELMIDNADIGGLSIPSHPHGTILGQTWFIDDGIEDEVGFSKAIYEDFEILTQQTHEHITDCVSGRRRGCPMCMMSEHCSNNNDPLDTLTGSMILDDVLADIRRS